MNDWTPPTCTNCHKPAPLIHNIPTPTNTQPYCCACWCFAHDNHPPRHPKEEPAK